MKKFILSVGGSIIDFCAWIVAIFLISTYIITGIVIFVLNDYSHNDIIAAFSIWGYLIIGLIGFISFIYIFYYINLMRDMNDNLKNINSILGNINYNIEQKKSRESEEKDTKNEV